MFYTIAFGSRREKILEEKVIDTKYKGGIIFTIFEVIFRAKIPKKKNDKLDVVSPMRDHL
jgi:hypothetical protein